MIVKCNLKPDTPLTPEEVAMIEAAAQRPVVYDEDSPPLTPETYAAFKRAAAERKELSINKMRNYDVG